MLGGLFRSFSKRPLALQIATLFATAAIPLILAAAYMVDRLVVEGQQRVRETLMLRAKTLASLVPVHSDYDSLSEGSG